MQIFPDIPLIEFIKGAFLFSLSRWYLTILPLTLIGLFIFCLIQYLRVRRKMHEDERVALLEEEMEQAYLAFRRSVGTQASLAFSSSPCRAKRQRQKEKQGEGEGEEDQWRLAHNVNRSIESVEQYMGEQKRKRKRERDTSWQEATDLAAVTFTPYEQAQLELLQARYARGEYDL